MPIRPENRARYPKDWKAISARIRFERAAGRCECRGQCGEDHAGRCTAMHGEPHPLSGSTVILTTMHLDHEPENCADENLLAGCQRCHNRYDLPMRRAGILARRRDGYAIGDLFKVRKGHRGVPAKDWSHLSDAELARTLFEYRDGAIYWIYRKCNNVQIGDRVGRLKENGYRDVRFRGRQFGEHRIIWLLLNGAWPDGEIDHINGNPNDNRIENLRCVTRSENMQNTRRGSKTTGTTLLANGRWQASIVVNGHRRHLGEHRTQELARNAYLKAKARLHPAAVWS